MGSQKSSNSGEEEAPVGKRREVEFMDGHIEIRQQQEFFDDDDDEEEVIVL